MVERFKPLRFSRAGIRGLKAAATIAINDRVHEMWAAGRNVYHLAFGESRFPVHPRIAEALGASAHKRSYTHPLGIAELRDAIAAYYQRRFEMDVTPEQVVVGPGSKSLIFSCLMALGEEVILPQPSWVSYAPQAHILGKPVTFVPTRPEMNFELELDVLEARIRESRHNWGNPEVFVVNSPKNPTGTVMRPEKVEALAGFARENELMVLSDEIYALTVFNSIPHVSISRFYPEGTVVFGGLSKSLPLGGWRFGTAILPRGSGGSALAHAISNIASNIWTCVTAPVQYAALVAYSGDPDIEEYIEICRRMHTIRTRDSFPLPDDGTPRRPVRRAGRRLLRLPLLREVARGAGGPGHPQRRGPGALSAGELRDRHSSGLGIPFGSGPVPQDLLQLHRRGHRRARPRPPRRVPGRPRPGPIHRGPPSPPAEGGRAVR